MKAHWEQSARLHHKCRGDAVSQGRDFLWRVGSNTKTEIFCSTMVLEISEEGGRGYYKPRGQRQGHTVVFFSESPAKTRRDVATYHGPE